MLTGRLSWPILFSGSLEGENTTSFETPEAVFSLRAIDGFFRFMVTHCHHTFGTHPHYRNSGVGDTIPQNISLSLVLSNFIEHSTPIELASICF